MSDYNDIPENPNIYSSGSGDDSVSEPLEFGAQGEGTAPESEPQAQSDAAPQPEKAPESEPKFSFGEQAQPEPASSGYGYSQQNPYQSGYQQRPAWQPNSQYNSAGGQYQQRPPQQNQQPRYTAPPVPPKKKSAGKKFLAVLLSLVVIVASVGIGASIGRRSGGGSNTPSSPLTTSSPGGELSTNTAVEVSTSKPNATQLSATDIAEATRQSVVGVMAYSQGSLEGEGSGVILCEDASGKYTYVITCAHVISSKGLEFTVMTLDGTSYPATLVGYDERTDIGVLRLEASGLSVAAFGDSSALRIGETVYAIGNPGGSEYFGSMTSGIVSAIDRSISSTYTMKVIQHDAAINPGNSGGALVNTSGQVVGINSSKIADTDYEGMGFAVPMSTAKSVAQALIAYGYVPNRPKLGIQYSDVSNYQFYTMLVRMKELPLGSLIISAISTDSDLADSDVKAGDLIISVNGANLDTADVLLDLIEGSSVGDTLKLGICRVDQKTYKTEIFDVNVKLIEDKGTSQYTEQETTTATPFPYGYGGSGSYEDFFRQFFGF